MKLFRPAILAAVLLTAVAGTAYWIWRPAAPASAELATPALALAWLELPAPEKEKKLFFTPAAAPFLSGSRETLEKKAREFEIAAQNPKAWRALDRQERFEALLLTGSPAEFRPLLNHLREASDWRVTHVDPTSIIFQRPPATGWTPKNLETLKAAFATHSKEEKVMMRVQTAHRLIALGEFRSAKELLDEATTLDPRSGPAWAETASWHAAQGQWDHALETSERAVRYGKKYAPALAVKANALFAHGKFDEALQITRQLIEDSPNDGPTLYLHAKVTHSARAYQEEIETLRKIIALSESYAMPTGTWRVFLAQAYGFTGQAELALEQFEIALKDPGLSKQERAFAEKGIERIRGH